jgi:hypothetical protein
VNWLEDHWLDLLGWGGSALLVGSLLQVRVLRFRVLNLVACLTLIVFNGLLEIWPMVAMSVALSAVNVWIIVSLIREHNDEDAFEVLETKPDDSYLQHVLSVHAQDIARFQPDFDPSRIGHTSGSVAYLVQKGDETVGVVVIEIEGHTAFVLLDYVTPRYRDFSPGEFVWRRSGMLIGKGIRRVVSPPHMVGAYYGRVGFRRDGASWVMDY